MESVFSKGSYLIPKGKTYNVKVLLTKNVLFNVILTKNVWKIFIKVPKITLKNGLPTNLHIKV